MPWAPLRRTSRSTRSATPERRRGGAPREATPCSTAFRDSPPIAWRPHGAAPGCRSRGRGRARARPTSPRRSSRSPWRSAARGPSFFASAPSGSHSGLPESRKRQDGREAPASARGSARAAPSWTSCSTPIESSGARARTAWAPVPRPSRRCGSAPPGSPWSRPTDGSRTGAAAHASRSKCRSPPSSRSAPRADRARGAWDSRSRRGEDDSRSPPGAWMERPAMASPRWASEWARSDQRSRMSFLLSEAPAAVIR